MDLLLTILAILVALGVILAAMALLLVVMGVGADIALGKAAEWVFDRLVPRRRTGLGTDGVVGRSGTVVSVSGPHPSQSPEAMVRVGGELWRARSAPGTELCVGQRVEVVGLEGLVAVVAPERS